MTKTERITTAKAGEQVSIKLGYGGTTREHQVLAPCELKDNGTWYCVTHNEGFANQMQKDGHISDYGKNGKGKHKLVWLCFAHGPEQP